MDVRRGEHVAYPCGMPKTSLSISVLRERTRRVDRTLRLFASKTDAPVIPLPLLLAAVASGVMLWFVSQPLSGALVLTLTLSLLAWAIEVRLEAGRLAGVSLTGVCHRERVDIAFAWWRLSRLIGRSSTYLAGVALGVSIPSGLNFFVGRYNTSMFTSLMQCLGAACSIATLFLLHASQKASLVAPLLVHLKPSEEGDSKV